MTESSPTGFILALGLALSAGPAFAAEIEDHRLLYLGAHRDVRASTSLEIALDTAVMAHLGGRRGLLAVGPAEAFLMAGADSSGPLRSCSTPKQCRETVDRLAPELGRIATFLRATVTRPAPGRVVLVLEHGHAQSEAWTRHTSVEMPVGTGFLSSFAKDLLDTAFDLKETAPRRVLRAKNVPDGARIWIPCVEGQGDLPSQAERLVGGLLAIQLSVYDNISDVRQNREECCETPRCEIDRAVREGADHLVLAELERNEDAITHLTLKLVEVKELRIVNQVFETYLGPLAELPAAIQYVASRLVGYRMTGQGRLHIVSTVDQAILFVSEDIVPFDGSDATLIRSAQRYPLRLTADGYVDVERDAFVLEGRLREVYLDPVPQASASLWTNGWFWAALGVGLVGIGTGLAVAFTPNSGPITFSSQN